jgi:hypothetical protein
LLDWWRDDDGVERSEFVLCEFFLFEEKNLLLLAMMVAYFGFAHTLDGGSLFLKTGDLMESVG